MNIGDVVSGKVTSLSIEEKNKYRKILKTVKPENTGKSLGDSLDVQRKSSPEIARIQDIQRSYMKNDISLKGLKELGSILSLFDPQTANEASYSQLGRDIEKVIHTTRFNGENVISYFNTKVDDERSLYTLRMNIDSEIKNIQGKVNSARKQIGQYLVRLENEDVMSEFSAKKSATIIASMLKDSPSPQAFKNVANIGQLLAGGKQ